MATWTTSKTWAYKETLSSADMNTYVRDNNNATDAHPNGVYVKTSGAKVRLGNNLSLVFNNTGAAESATIKQDTSNRVYINNPDGGIVLDRTGSTIAWALAGTTQMRLTTGGDLQMRGGGGIAIFNSTNTEYFYAVWSGSNIEIGPTSGNIHIYDSSHNVRVRIYSSSGGSAYGDNYHDGSNYYIGTGTGNVRFTPTGTYVEVYGGKSLIVQGSSNARGLNFRHDNTNGIIETIGSTGGDIYIIPDGGDVALRSGTALVMFNSGNTHFADYKHDGVNGILATSTGDMVFDPNNNVVRGTDGVYIRAVNSSNTKYLSMQHDGTDGILEANSGDILLKPAGGNVEVRGTGVSRLDVYDTTGTSLMRLSHDGTDGYLLSSGGDINMQPFTGDVNFLASVRGKFWNSTDTENINIYHNDLNGVITTTSGDIVFDPAGGNVKPHADNTEILGSSTYRWADVKSVLINGADICLANGYLFREWPARKDDIDKPFSWMKKNADRGVQLLNNEGDIIAIFGKNGTIYANGFEKLDKASGDLLEPFQEERSNLGADIQHIKDQIQSLEDQLAKMTA